MLSDGTYSSQPLIRPLSEMAASLAIKPKQDHRLSIASTSGMVKTPMIFACKNTYWQIFGFPELRNGRARRQFKSNVISIDIGQVWAWNSLPATISEKMMDQSLMRSKICTLMMYHFYSSYDFSVIFSGYCWPGSRVPTAQLDLYGYWYIRLMIVPCTPFWFREPIICNIVLQANIMGCFTMTRSASKMLNLLWFCLLIRKKCHSEGIE